MFKVVAVDAVRVVPTVEKEILAEVDAQLVAADCHSEEDVVQATGDADGILLSLSPITRRVIASWKKNKVIARYGIGVDTVDLQAATDHGVFVTNVPDFCYDEVSDTAMSLILAVTRKVVRMHALVSEESTIGSWPSPSTSRVERRWACWPSVTLPRRLPGRPLSLVSRFLLMILMCSPPVLPINRSNLWGWRLC